jgi:hypothetical protein
MSDRTQCLTVVLDGTYRTDDIEQVVNAIKMIKGVADVGVNVKDPADYLAYTSVRFELEQKLWDALKKDKS